MHPSSPPGSLRRRVAAGLALLTPALAALYWSYAGPTIWTVRSSFQDVDLMSGDGDEVGTANYAAVGGHAFHDVAYGLAFCLFPLLTFIFAAGLLALAAHHAGRTARWVARVALALPMLAGLAP